MKQKLKFERESLIELMDKPGQKLLTFKTVTRDKSVMAIHPENPSQKNFFQKNVAMEQIEIEIDANQVACDISAKDKYLAFICFNEKENSF